MGIFVLLYIFVIIGDLRILFTVKNCDCDRGNLFAIYEIMITRVQA